VAKSASVAKLVYLTTARDTLLEIQHYVAHASGSAELARAFVGRIRRKCRDLAASPFPLGRVRSELRADLRSWAIGNHVIFFRASPELVEIVAVVDGHRDLGVFVEDLPV
jgi:toxin ParE1/3/4